MEKFKKEFCDTGLTFAIGIIHVICIIYYMLLSIMCYITTYSGRKNNLFVMVV